MEAGIGLFLSFLPWENGIKVTGTAIWFTGNGKKIKLGMGKIFFNHGQSRHHLFPGVEKHEKIVQAPCSFRSY